MDSTAYQNLLTWWSEVYFSTLLIPEGRDTEAREQATWELIIKDVC